MWVSPPAAIYALSRMAQAAASVTPGPASLASAATASSLIRAPARSHSTSSPDFTSRRRVYSWSRNSTRPAAATSLSCARAGTGPMTPARTDIRLGCEQAGVRDVVVVGDEEHIALLGREDNRGLPGHRPARQPLDGRSGTVGAVDQGVIDPALLEHAGQRETSALHLDRGECRVTGRGLPGPEMP